MSNNVYQPVGGINNFIFLHKIFIFWLLHKTLRPKGLGRKLFAST